MLQRLVEEKQRKERERVRLEDEAFAKAHALAIETNATHIIVGDYLPVCLTKVSGIRVPAPMGKDLDHAASARIGRELYENTASISADNASEKKPLTSASSNTANPSSSKSS